MKLHEIMHGVGNGTIETEPLNWWDIGGTWDSDYLFYTIMGRDHNARDSEVLNAAVTPRLKVVVLEEWLCTDTHVGQYLYILDDEPACIKTKDARKSTARFHFIANGRPRLVAFCEELVKLDEFPEPEGSITYDTELNCILSPEDVAEVSSFSHQKLYPLS